MRIYWDQILVGHRRRRARHADHAARSGVARRCSGAASRRRSRPTAASLSATTTPASRAASPWKQTAGHATRAMATCARCSAQSDDMFVIARPGDEIALSFDAAALPPLAGRLDAHLPALRGRLQQGDGHQLGQPGFDRAAAVPRHDAAIPTRADEHYPRLRRARATTSPATTRASWPRRCRRSIAAPPSRGQTPMTAALFRRRVPDRSAPIRSTARQMRVEHRSHAGDDRRGGGRQRAVPAGPPGRLSGVRARRAGLCRPSPSCSTSSPCRSPTSTPIASHAKAREHDIYIQSGSMIEADPRWPGVGLQHDLPDRAGGHSLQVPEGQPVDPVRGPRQPARSRRLRRAALPGRRHADRPDRLRDLLRLAVSRRRSASSPPTAPRCWSACRPTWIRGARPSR